MSIIRSKRFSEDSEAVVIVTAIKSTSDDGKVEYYRVKDHVIPKSEWDKVASQTDAKGNKISTADVVAQGLKMNIKGCHYKGKASNIGPEYIYKKRVCGADEVNSVKAELLKEFQ